MIGELSTNDLVDVETSKRRNLANSEPSLFPYLPYGLLVVASLLVLTILLFDLNLRMLGLNGFFIFLLWVIFQLMVHNSTEFVDCPSNIFLSRQRSKQH